MQCDFCEGGPLAVEGANGLVSKINDLRKYKFDFIGLSQDWHPKNHCSFQENNKDSELFKDFKLATGEM